jgi:hypothetical protein
MSEPDVKRTQYRQTDSSAGLLTGYFRAREQNPGQGNCSISCTTSSVTFLPD